MTKLADLKLDETAAPAVDFDAPEGGQTPPPIYPGLYTLLFKMPENVEDWFDSNSVEMIKGNPVSKRSFLVVNYQPSVVASHATRDDAGKPVPNDPISNLPITLGPQRASAFKSDRMLISELGELVRALGVRLEGSFLQKDAQGVPQIEAVCRQLNGKASFMCEVGWRAYFKGTETTITTHPRSKKKGDLPWPRLANGEHDLLAVNPSTGEKAYGYAVVAKIIAPKSA